MLSFDCSANKQRYRQYLPSGFEMELYPTAAQDTRGRSVHAIWSYLALMFNSIRMKEAELSVTSFSRPLEFHHSHQPPACIKRRRCSGTNRPGSLPPLQLALKTPLRTVPAGDRYGCAICGQRWALLRLRKWFPLLYTGLPDEEWKSDSGAPEGEKKYSRFCVVTAT